MGKETNENRPYIKGPLKWMRRSCVASPIIYRPPFETQYHDWFHRLVIPCLHCHGFFVELLELCLRFSHFACTIGKSFQDLTTLLQLTKIYRCIYVCIYIYIYIYVLFVPGTSISIPKSSIGISFHICPNMFSSLIESSTLSLSPSQSLGIT
mgnify:CR=1 FL=1